MSRRPRWIAATAAALFLVLHLPYLPQSLEDVDSINFALGVRDFDVAHHQPHPPGYPVYIVLGKALHAAGASEVHALALLSAIAGALGLLAAFALFSGIDRSHAWRALAATALAVSAPLYWFTADRPLTDAAGLAAALGIQALIVWGDGERPLVGASFLAALASGIRSQVAWLTVPLLAFAVARHARAKRIAGPAIAAFALGGCAWAVPLVMLTGGPAAYWRALANQGNEDLSNVTMLWTTQTVHEVEQALYYAFVAPWAMPALATAILLFAAAGLAAALGRARSGESSRSALITIAIAFLPYFAFDVVFQETFTSRYALPLVVPLAYLAARGLELARPRAAAVAVAAVAMAGMHIGGTSIARYASEPAPAFRLLKAMNADSATADHAPRVLAMHRREDLDLRRPMDWAGSPRVERLLPAPPKHEWLSVEKYWRGGGRGDVWFVADPLRSDLALIGVRDAPVRFHYTLDYPVLLGGTRPYEMDWYRMSPPDWYLAEGWALTPETAGVAHEDHRGPGVAPIDGWIRRWPGAGTLMLGGRNMRAAGADAHIHVALDTRVLDDETLKPGFFLREIPLAPGALTGEGDYAHLTVSADSPDVAVEQFDARPSDRIVFGYDDGWHEREYNPATGQLWRWTSDHGDLRVHTPQQALSITLEGEVEAASRSRVTIMANGRIVAAQDIGETFSIRQTIPRDFVRDGVNTITITTDQSYVPAERRGRSRDRRLLGLKVYRCEITPAS